MIKTKPITAITCLVFCVLILTGCKEYNFSGRLSFLYDDILVFNEKITVHAVTEKRKIKSTIIQWKNHDLVATVADSYCFDSQTLGESCEAVLLVNFKPVFEISGFENIGDETTLMTGSFTFLVNPDDNTEGEMNFESWSEEGKFNVSIVMNGKGKSINAQPKK